MTTIRRLAVTAAAAFVVFLAWCTFAAAQDAPAGSPACGTREDADRVLANSGEALLGGARGIAGAFLPQVAEFEFEVWVDPVDGSWSILSVNGDSVCFEAFGKGWAFAKPAGAPA